MQQQDEESGPVVQLRTRYPHDVEMLHNTCLQLAACAVEVSQVAEVVTRMGRTLQLAVEQLQKTVRGLIETSQHDSVAETLNKLDTPK